MIIRPPLSPTESNSPFLSNVIADSKSCLAMAVGSGSPRLLMLVRLIGSISSFMEVNLPPLLYGDGTFLFVSDAYVDADEHRFFVIESILVSTLLPYFLVGEGEH